MSVIAAPKYLRFARQHIAVGAAKAGRDAAAHRIPTFVIYRADLDGDVARRRRPEALAFYLQAVGPTPMTGAYDINERLAEILALGDLDRISAALPEEWVETFTIAGTPKECVGKIRAFLERGRHVRRPGPVPGRGQRLDPRTDRRRRPAPYLTPIREAHERACERISVTAPSRSAD